MTELHETFDRLERWLAVYLENHPGAVHHEIHELANSFERAPLYLGDLIVLKDAISNAVGEDGVRYVVVEIPPEITDEQADVITEDLFKYVGEINEQDDLAGDLFIYRQHSITPFEKREEADGDVRLVPPEEGS